MIEKIVAFASRHRFQFDGEEKMQRLFEIWPTLTKSVSFLPLCNSLIDGSFKLGRRSSKKMDPFFGGVARGEKLFLHLAGSYHSFLRRFRSPVATFHLQDNKYPKSNFSTTFSFTALLLFPPAFQFCWFHPITNDTLQQLAIKVENGRH